MIKGSKCTPEMIEKNRLSHPRVYTVKLCKKCGKNIVGIVHRPGRTDFCSVKCSKVGLVLTEAHKNKISLNNTRPMLGKKHSEKTRLLQSKLKEGKPHPTQRGSLHWNYQGGVTPEQRKVRKSLEMNLWKKTCMERDNFTCQKTGVRGGRLEVHHVQNFSSYEGLRTSIENGVTLSRASHKEFHHLYGCKNNTREQLIEFLNKPK